MDCLTRIVISMTPIPYIILLLCCARASGDVIVTTKYGIVRGVRTNQSLAFIGIPYASPPVGSLRWQPPTDPLPWEPAIYNATELKPGCPQHGCTTSNPAFVCPVKTSESCLFLNIWTPLDATCNGPYPVMVYLHGGNFVHMSASSPLYNGEYFAAIGRVVLVTLDYRLGVFGFLYTGDESPDAKGNYGVQDQRRALLWVRDNILVFGGDPTKVTLFGQSAGAQSISIHLMSDKSEGLFRNAIYESSPFDIPFKSRDEALYLAGIIKKMLNCTTEDYMPCLRSKSEYDIAEAQLKSRAKVTSLKILEFFEPLGPYVDGNEVPMQSIKAISQGSFRVVPTIMGTVTEESRVFIYEVWTKPVKYFEYDAAAFALYPRHTIEILKRYPVPPGTEDTRDALTQLSTDFIFTCCARNISRNITDYHKGELYRYVFNHAFSFSGWGNFTFCEGHVCHGEEIVFVFHSGDQSGFNFNADEEVLSKSMIYYWTNFAYTSDPNLGPHAVSANWPVYGNTDLSMEFKTPGNIVISNYRKEYCDFWDTIGYTA